MEINNAAFSQNEIALLNFILSHPFNERNETIEYFNQLSFNEIVRDYSPYYRILIFSAKNNLSNQTAGMREIISLRAEHDDSCAPTVFTLYEKDGLPYAYEIFNADSSAMNTERILEGKVVLN